MKIIISNANFEEKNFEESKLELKLIQYKVDPIQKRLTFTASTSDVIPIMEKWFSQKILEKTVIIEDDKGNLRIFKDAKPENRALPLIGVNNIICSYVTEVNYEKK